jgi:hypothetical protein
MLLFTSLVSLGFFTNRLSYDYNLFKFIGPNQSWALSLVLSAVITLVSFPIGLAPKVKSEKG